MAISKKRSFSVADDMVFSIDKPVESEKPKTEPQAEEKKPVIAEIVNEPVTEEAPAPVKPIERSEPRAAGRPKGDAKKAVTIYIPIDTYEDMNNGPIPMLRGKVSEYIVSLIEADLKENEDTYKKISAVMTSSRR